MTTMRTMTTTMTTTTTTMTAEAAAERRRRRRWRRLRRRRRRRRRRTRQQQNAQPNNQLSNRITNRIAEIKHTKRAADEPGHVQKTHWQLAYQPSTRAYKLLAGPVSQRTTHATSKASNANQCPGQTAQGNTKLRGNNEKHKKPQKT